MLAAKTEILTRDEIVALIYSRSERLHVKPELVLRDYVAGNFRDFGKLSDIYALCELLDADDPLIAAA
jgi:hypothetical protein